MCCSVLPVLEMLLHELEGMRAPAGTSKLEVAYGSVLGALQNALLSAQNPPSGTEAMLGLHPQ